MDPTFSVSAWLVFYLTWKIRENGVEESGESKCEIVNIGLSLKFWHIITYI